MKFAIPIISDTETDFLAGFYLNPISEGCKIAALNEFCQRRYTNGEELPIAFLVMDEKSLEKPMRILVNPPEFSFSVV